MPFLKTFDFYDRTKEHIHCKHKCIFILQGSAALPFPIEGFFSQMGLSVAKWRWHHAKEYLFPAFFHEPHMRISLSPSRVPPEQLFPFLFHVNSTQQSLKQQWKGLGLGLTGNAHLKWFLSSVYPPMEYLLFYKPCDRTSLSPCRASACCTTSLTQQSLELHWKGLGCSWLLGGGGPTQQLLACCFLQTNNKPIK